MCWEKHLLGQTESLSAKARGEELSSGTTARRAGAGQPHSSTGDPSNSVLSKCKQVRLCLEPPGPWSQGRAFKLFFLIKLNWLRGSGWVCFSCFGMPGAKRCGGFEFYNRKWELRRLAQVQIIVHNLEDSRSFFLSLHFDLLLLTSNWNCFLSSLSSGKQNIWRRNEEISVNQRSSWQEEI